MLVRTTSTSVRAALHHHGNHQARCMRMHAATGSPTQATAVPRTILVLGGTGFVGSNFISAARRQGHRIVSLSRRGRLPGTPDSDPHVTWVSGDATDPDVVARLVASHPTIDACMHCTGLLLDEGSGLSSLNRLASGSGSQPGAGASYDQVTRQTSLNAMQALAAAQRQRQGAAADAAAAAAAGPSAEEAAAASWPTASTSQQPQQQLQQRPGHGRLPFVFVSAAEAGWTFTAPVEWLERYLIAKRAVESALLGPEYGPLLRGVALRPSLIWSPERPQALPSVLPFYLGHAIGLPFVDKPVTVGTLVGAALAALADEREEGVMRYMDMERLAKQ